MNRTPPKYVRQILRHEVGFGCPLCANPYLEWHHFDPPWHEQEHHNHEGMIALCAEHHKKADAGAYTKDQLRGFKIRYSSHGEYLKGKFEWLRQKILAVVGGIFYYEVPVIFQFRNQPVIWFNRDDDGYLLLNIRMLSKSKEPRLFLEDNFWMTKGNMKDFECPPSGKRIYALYPNGDMIRIEYLELASAEDISRRYSNANPEGLDSELPITAVEVNFRVAGTEIEFGPRWTRLPGNNYITGSFSHGRVGLAIS